MLPSWPCTRLGRPDTTRAEACSPPTGFFPSPTGWKKQQPPASPRLSSRVARSVTRRSWRPRTGITSRWSSPAAASSATSLGPSMTVSAAPVRERPPYLFAALTALVVLGIYLLTLAPTTAFWDTSEYIAAAKVLGIPHPPGNPLFVLLAHTWGLLPLAEAYAVRINLFAAVTSAAAAGLWFL